jgi:hypothetical protein
MLQRARENSFASATSRMHLDRHPFVTPLPSTAMLHTSRLSFVTRAADDDEVTDSPLKDFCEEVLPLSLQFLKN